MDGYLINIANKYYELKMKAEELAANNSELEKRAEENEENLTSTMMACTELYEMLLLVSEVDDYNYGKDGLVKMASAMVKVYVNLVKRGLKTLDEVPERLRAEVEAELEGDE